MNRFEKIASSDKEDKDKKVAERIVASGAGVGVGISARPAARKAFDAIWALQMKMKPYKEAERAAYTSWFPLGHFPWAGRENGRRVYKNIPGSGGPHYEPTTGNIHINQRLPFIKSDAEKAVLAHEMGHAMVDRFIPLAAHIPLSLARPITALAAPVVALTSDEKDVNRNVALASIPQAYQIADEALASIVGSIKYKLKPRQMMQASLGLPTYVALNAVPAAMGLAAAKIYHHFKKKKHGDSDKSKP